LSLLEPLHVNCAIRSPSTGTLPGASSAGSADRAEAGVFGLLGRVGDRVLARFGVLAGQIGGSRSTSRSADEEHAVESRVPRSRAL
jgi:hypothetical protein